MSLGETIHSATTFSSGEISPIDCPCTMKFPFCIPEKLTNLPEIGAVII